MQFTENSMSFAKKILKHYPVTEQNHQCEHTCSHSQPTAFQPFQHMHDHRKERQIYEKPTHQKLQNIKYFKQMGNSRFKDKKYDEASYFYQKAIVYSDYTFPEQKQQVAQMELLVQQANMNNAICLIKKNNWTKALVNLNEATKGQQSQKNQKTRKLVLSTRKKAYFWLTKYYINEGNFEKANQQIQKLEALDNEVSTIEQAAQLKQLVLEEIRKYQKSTQNISKKMFHTSDQ